MALSVIDNASLKALNTFGVQARARTLVKVDDEADLPAALERCGRDGPALVLGAGSNIVLADDIEGSVLQLCTRGIRTCGTDSDGATLLQARAGESWDGLVQTSLDLGLAGLENLALIPGSVGASPVQNIGAYGVELSDRLAFVTAFHLDSLRFEQFQAAQCEFGYRTSLFKAPGNRWLIVSITLALSPCTPVVLTYPGVRDELERRAVRTPGARDVADAVAAIRRRKLPDPAQLGNAGSFFKNPVLPLAHARELARKHPGMPVHPVGGPTPCAEGLAKLSAGWLIEQCGWRGHRQGAVGVHENHALILVNYGGAHGRDILELARHIQRSVHERFGVTLQAEPLIHGAELPG
jgi:UDP-N-acetylmuramate dehydrogenase